jgi:hypothetical protein
MNIRKIGVVLLGLFLAAMVMVPMVSAAEGTQTANADPVPGVYLTKLMDNPEGITNAYPAPQNKDAVINSLMGKDMTVAEFYDTLYPGVVSKLPENVRTLYKNTKMTWPSGTASP